MTDAVAAARAQFAFTIMFHYLFPILTMGLGVLIAVLKTLHLLKKGERQGEVYAASARFWARIFALTFGMGVVTGIPMEFQFGTNWARFSHYAGLGGVLAFVLLSMHGAAYLGMKTDGPMQARAQRAVGTLWWAVVVGVIAIVAASFTVRPDFTTTSCAGRGC